jgi:hypothetical protein
MSIRQPVSTRQHLFIAYSLVIVVPRERPITSIELSEPVPQYHNFDNGLRLHRHQQSTLSS